jgi:hypothetical protein
MVVITDSADALAGLGLFRALPQHEFVVVA